MMDEQKLSSGRHKVNPKMKHPAQVRVLVTGDQIKRVNLCQIPCIMLIRRVRFIDFDWRMRLSTLGLT